MQVRFENVVKRYGDFYAVKDLTLTIESGSLHFLLGPSGCGKTTTLRMLAGLEDPTSGRIWFDDKDVTNTPAAERGIGMVFQNYALWPHMTVRKNIEYGLKLRKLTQEEMSKRMKDVLDYTQLNQFVDRLPGQLSGGQQQRVALARALAIRPNVLLLDEPLSNLDAKLRLEMRDNITRIHRETGITTVYVTHDQKEALSMGTHISVMRAGDMIQTAPPRRLYHVPQTAFIAGFIGEANIFEAEYEGESNGVHKVTTSWGTLNAQDAVADYSPGQRVALSIRPEAIHVNFEKTRTRTNTFDIKLSHLTYLGESEQITGLTESGTPIRVNVFDSPEHDLQAGDPISLTIPAEKVLILPATDSMSSGT